MALESTLLAIGKKLAQELIQGSARAIRRRLTKSDTEKAFEAAVVDALEGAFPHS